MITRARWRRRFSRNSLLKHAGDALLITLAYYLAFFLRFDGYILPQYWRIFLNTLPLVLLTKIVSLHYYHLYASFWRYTGLPEIKELVKAILLALLVTSSSYALTMGLSGFPRSVFFLDGFLSLILLASFRALPRLVREFRPPELSVLPARKRTQGRIEKVIIFGAGDLGATLARQIQQTYAGKKQIVGFIDDAPELDRARISGVPVLGDRSILADLAARKEPVDQIIVAISTIKGEELRRVVEHCHKYCTHVQIAPSLDELFMGRVSISDLREIQIEDLLGRDRVELDESRLENLITGKRVLVTGAGGSIGSELCFQILKFFPQRLILLGRGENSIYSVKNRLLRHSPPDQLVEVIPGVINFAKLDRVFGQYRPQLIFHAAADKHVPLMELNPDEAVLNNIIGTQNVLKAADKHQVEKVVCISTDKAVNPSSIMGCCKRIMELLVLSFDSPHTTACAVRFGNVLGSRGSVIPLFKKQIAAGGPITVTHPEIKRFFMTIPEAVLLVLQAGTRCDGREIFLLEMGKPVRIVDLARQMVTLSGLNEKKIPIQVVGLRPGEKLEEELAFSHETLEKTSVPKLYRLKSLPLPHDQLNGRVDELKELAIKMDFDAIRRVLKKLVPEYQPGQDFSPMVEREAVRGGV